MTAAILFTVLGTCAMAPYIYLRCKRKLLPGIFLKIATSMFFILTTCAAVLANSGQFAAYQYLFLGILAGQVFGLLGDYWLDMKDMYTQHKEPYMFAGFISFFICHVFYNAGLIRTYGAGWGLAEAGVIAATGLGLMAIILLTEKPMKLRYGKFKGIASAYSLIFGVSMATSLLSWLGSRNPQALVMFIGLGFFLLSDLFLSGTFFGKGKERPFDYTANYICYFGGQFVISLSLLWLI